MQKRSVVSLTCPVCLEERIVRKDGAGSLCRSCRAKKNSALNIGRFIDMHGFISGKLKALRPLYQNDQYFWVCICECGNEAIVLGNKLRSGHTKSCGCITKIQKGLSTSPTYRSWNAMIQRCYDSSVAHYKNYGAKGIIVCDRWKDSFLDFLKDMGERPPGSSIDRIDNLKNYEPSNCKWSSNKEQARNRSNNHLIEAFGKKQTLTDWAEQTGIRWETILSRINRGWSSEKALTKRNDMPLKGTPKQKMKTELKKFSEGKLHSGSKKGPVVKSKAQALAIALNEAGLSKGKKKRRKKKM